MKSLRTIILWLFAIVFGIAGFALAIFFLLPDLFFQGAIERQLREKAGVYFSAQEFERGFFSLTAINATVHPLGKNDLAINFTSIKVCPEVLSIITGSPAARISGELAGGFLKARASVKGNSSTIKIELEKINAAEIPAIRSLGFDGSADISGNVDLVFPGSSCPEGDIKLNSQKITMNGVAGPILSLLFSEELGASADISLRACKADIKKFWLNGKAVSAKLNGSVDLDQRDFMQSQMDLTADIMTDAGKDSALGILALLTGYKRSSSHYSLKLKGSFSAPLVN